MVVLVSDSMLLRCDRSMEHFLIGFGVCSKCFDLINIVFRVYMINVMILIIIILYATVMYI
jgi:hypothetical protein